MSINNQGPIVFNFQNTSPVVGFLPYKGWSGSAPSGSVSGSMSGTNTIYSQILDLMKMKSLGIQTNWTGTPAGTISVMASDDGAAFYALSGFNPAITQPAGSAGGGLIQIAPFSFRFLFLQYVNSSGSGSLTASAHQKD